MRRWSVAELTAMAAFTSSLGFCLAGRTLAGAILAIAGWAIWGLYMVRP